ncbi:hypothetical protein CCAX7_005260 [Capsulimonas corticalis]|uniref:Uncharacterized protein n=1 Tax=Capsulimonas corticalis TaxID=2219043 RepID=A0A402D368_9BACT|nr:hypothetical protein [Capsulimonas corticalis]BDI28475.1 hypothetical protein CCAX7_005260 [Capsulimonas corticalis]
MAIKELPPITFPHTFAAGNTYRWGMGLFSAMGLFATGNALSHHQPSNAFVAGVLTAGFVFLLFAVLSFRIRVDGTGMTQSWLIGKSAITWPQVARVDRSRRVYSIHIADGTEPIMISFLSTPAQIAVAQESIRCAGLTPTRGKIPLPAVERWDR